MKGQAIIQQIIPAIVIPMLLVVGLLVYANFSESVRESDVYVIDVADESLGTGVDNHTVDNVPMSETGCSVVIVTNDSGTLTSSNYTITDYETGTINVHTCEDVALTIDYCYLGGDAWDAYDSTSDNTYAGFNLASILPLVIFAAAIISIIVGAFLIFGRR